MPEKPASMASGALLLALLAVPDLMVLLTVPETLAGLTNCVLIDRENTVAALRRIDNAVAPGLHSDVTGVGACSENPVVVGTRSTSAGRDSDVAGGGHRHVAGALCRGRNSELSAADIADCSTVTSPEFQALVIWATMPVVAAPVAVTLPVPSIRILPGPTAASVAKFPGPEWPVTLPSAVMVMLPVPLCVTAMPRAAPIMVPPRETSRFAGVRSAAARGEIDGIKTAYRLAAAVDREGAAGRRFDARMVFDAFPTCR